jgi:hypothetical protein
VKIIPVKKSTETTTQDPKVEEEKASFLDPVAMTINILKVDE